MRGERAEREPKDTMRGLQDRMQISARAVHGAWNERHDGARTCTTVCYVGGWIKP